MLAAAQGQRNGSPERPPRLKKIQLAFGREGAVGRRWDPRFTVEGHYYPIYDATARAWTGVVAGPHPQLLGAHGLDADTGRLRARVAEFSGAFRDASRGLWPPSARKGIRGRRTLVTVALATRLNRQTSSCGRDARLSG